MFTLRCHSVAIWSRCPTQIDLRFSKAMTLCSKRAQGMVDFYKYFNANTVPGVNTWDGRSWLAPRVGADVNFGGRPVKFGIQSD